jgi:hypothetical protein
VKEEGGISENLPARGVSRLKRDIAVFAFFLFLSFIFWYLNSLSKEIETGIVCQVKFTNIPGGRQIIDETPADLNLFLKGPGYSILKLKLSGRKTPVSIDISKVSYKRTQGSKAFSYYIITSGLAKSLSVQMRSGCEITSVKPDTLFFTLDKAMANSSSFTEKRSENKKKR